MPDEGTYNVNAFKNAHWLVYINGLEIPVTGVTTNFEVWNFPTATVELVPHPILKRIGNEDRLQVVIFFLDVFSNPEDPTFRLLGEFEVVGWAYSNSRGGRSLQLNCVSHLQIFTQLFFFYMSSVDDIIIGSGVAYATGAHAGAGAKVFYPSSLFIKGLVPKGAASDSPGNEPDKKVAGAPEGETPAGDKPNTSDGQGDAQTVEAADSGNSDPSEAIVDTNEFIRAPIEFITNIFKALTAYIHPGATFTDKDGRVPADSTSVMGRNFFGRWMLRTQFHRRWVALPVMEDLENREAEGCFPVVKAIQGFHLLKIMQQNVMNSVGQASSVWDMLQMVYGNMYMEIVPIPAPAAVNQWKKTWEIEGPVSDDVITAGEAFGIPKKSKKKLDPAITSFVVKPQSVFGIPPKCNIIFPSMTTNLTFQENYMSQPTRLYMGETLVTDLLTSQGQQQGFKNTVAQLLTTGYPDVVSKRMKAFINQPHSNTKNFILYAEEFFKGPNTARINAPPWLFLLAQQSRQASLGNNSRYVPSDLSKEEWQKGGSNWKLFEKVQPFLSGLSAAGTVTPTKPKGKSIPTIPAGALYGFTWYESRFNPTAHRPGGAYGLMQIFVQGRDGSGVWPAASKDPRFDWNKEFHKLVANLSSTVPQGDQIGDDTVEYYDNNLKGVNIVNKTVLNNIFTKPGFNMILGYLYLQQVMLIQYSQYGYDKPNYNDVFAGYSAKGVGGLKAAKEGMPIKNKAGWLPEGQPKRYAIGAKAAWAHFSGGKYGDGSSLTYEDEISQEEGAEAVQAVVKAIALEEFGSTFDLFAKYEYYRMRYSQRSASVTMAFNPYIVPGFPCAIIDDLKNPVHLLGYVNGVTHSMNASSGSAGMRTTAQISFVRTLEEYRIVGVSEDKKLGQGVETEVKVVSSGAEIELPLSYDPADVQFQGNPNLTKDDWEVLEKVLKQRAKFIGHPFEPVWTVRDVFQHLDEAEKLYSRLFYHATRHSVPTAEKRNKFPKTRNLFNVSEFFRTVFTGDETDFLARDMMLGVATQELRTRYEAEATSYDRAMRYIARPSCSLIDYVKIWNRQAKISKLENAGKVTGKETHHESGGGRATYHFTRIYRLRPGPIQDKFTAKYKGETTARFIEYISGLTNVNMKTGAEGYEPTGDIEFTSGFPMMGKVNSDFGVSHPEMRFDWNETLEKYRDFILRQSFLTGGE